LADDVQECKSELSQASRRVDRNPYILSPAHCTAMASALEVGSVYRQLTFIALMTASVACAGPGHYVWYSDLSSTSAAAAEEYVIGPGDTLSIRVLGHDDLSTKVKVRADGRIAVPIIGELVASGRQPSVLRAEIGTRLKEFVVDPTITLNVDESVPGKILVLGEVPRPGVIPVDPSISLAAALAMSGGVTEYASRDRIFVIRAVPESVRIRFTWDAVTRTDPKRAGGFLLRGGDLIVVE
jgi:polysaccharide export outer membrane protein